MGVVGGFCFGFGVINDDRDGEVDLFEAKEEVVVVK